MAKINLKSICKHRSYTIDELSDVLHINKKTCFRWIEKGLKVVPGSKKPILIMGEDLAGFIGGRRSERRVKMDRYQFYCLTCKKPTYAKKGSMKKIRNKKTALCRVCNGKICRII